MKRMFLLASLMLFLSVSAYSQYWSIGPEAGYNRNKFYESGYKATPRDGFRIGFLAGYTFKSNVVLETGLAYDKKAGKISGGDLKDFNVYYISAYSLPYLHIPLLAGYRFRIDCFDILPQAGFYLDAGVGDGSGYMGYYDSYIGSDVESAVSMFEPSDGSPRSNQASFERLDAGLMFALSMQYKRVRFKLSYKHGLKSVEPVYGLRNGTFGASVAYMFDIKRKK